MHRILVVHDLLDPWCIPGWLCTFDDKRTYLRRVKNYAMFDFFRSMACDVLVCFLVVYWDRRCFQQSRPKVSCEPILRHDWWIPYTSYFSMEPFLWWHGAFYWMDSLHEPTMQIEGYEQWIRATIICRWTNSVSCGGPCLWCKCTSSYKQELSRR